MVESVHQEPANTNAGDSVTSVSPGLKTPIIGLLFIGPKSSYVLHFIWKLRSHNLEEDWRGTVSKLLEVQCEVSIVRHFMLSSAEKLYGDANSLFQHLAPVHSAKIIPMCLISLPTHLT